MNFPRTWRPRSLLELTLGCASALLAAACGGTLDAGHDRAPEQLPIGPDNPIIVSNDGAVDNWQGEYALLLAHANDRPLAGIIVGAAGSWSDLDANVSAWQALVESARASGLRDVPDALRSASAPLRRPGDGNIASTLPNDSDGARFIVTTSAALARPDRPVVVVTGGALTDVADAYLLDPSVTERVIVVSSLGSGFSDDAQLARMGIPNGEIDPWADTIVVQKFRYVQVSTYYDQLADVPAERLTELPDNAFGAWMRAKQPDIFDIAVAADQVGVLAAGLREFTRAFTRVSQSGSDGELPALAPDAQGRAWLVTASDAAAARARFWQVLLDPATFPQ